MWCPPAADSFRFTWVKVAVVKETTEAEARVALVPDLVPKLTAIGYEVVVEPGAGQPAQFADAEYEEAGAVVAADPFDDAELVLSVQPLTSAQIRRLAAGTSTISFFAPGQLVDDVTERRDLTITTYSMELVPRISRAQSMDALSSQALVSGYRAGIVAAGLLRRFFPLNMTAAGTVTPAEVVVLGAGVAGLQAIATCKRLGAVVKAYDVRAAAAEEIRSMGAVAIELELETLEGTGGYAREMTEDRADRQRELLDPLHRGGGRAHHDGRRARPAGADARHRRDGRADAARVRRRRPGGRVWRQRRGLPARRSGRDRPRAGLGRAQRTEPDARPGESAVRAERRQHRHPDDRRGRVRSRLLRRDRVVDGGDPSGRHHPRSDEAGTGGRPWMSPLSG